MPRRTTVVFDLDLTLLEFPSDRAVLARALEAVTGVVGILDPVLYHGRSDRWIIQEAGRLAGLDGDRLFERYEAVYTQIKEFFAKRYVQAITGNEKQFGFITLI